MRAGEITPRQTGDPAAGEGAPRAVPRRLVTRLLGRLVRALSPGAARRAYDRSGVLTSPRLFYEELKVLGLHGRPFDWDEYRRRLAAHLGMEIHVMFLEEDGDPVLCMLLAQEGMPGLVLRDEETADALVVVSAALDELSATAVIWHELAHVAGGHPVPPAKLLPSRGPQADTSAEAQEGFWDPPRGVLGGPAPRDEELCERDARLRAELALQASLFGHDPHHADESFFLLNGS